MVGRVIIVPDGLKGQFLSCCMSFYALVFVNVYSCVSVELKGVQLNPFRSHLRILGKTSFEGQM